MSELSIEWNRPVWRPSAGNPTASLNSQNLPQQNGSDSAIPSAAQTPVGAPAAGGPFEESWSVRLNDPATQRALFLRFRLLVSRNGFRRISEIWAVHSQKNAAKETSRTALRQTYDIQSFEPLPDGGFRLGQCEFRHDRIHGSIQAKGQTIEWNFQMTPRQMAAFEIIPQPIRKTGLIKNSILSPQADLSFTGSTMINGERSEWNGVPGMQTHQSGGRSGYSWIHGHCNTFMNEQGVPVPFVFEGITIQGQLLGGLLGGIPTPRMTSLYFLYQGEKHHFNTVRDAVRMQSKYNLTEWRFQAERGDLQFRGVATCEHKDFAGLSSEDTAGSLIYLANSQLSDLEIHVYRRGKLETALRGQQTASIEIVNRVKSPYVPLLF